MSSSSSIMTDEEILSLDAAALSHLLRTEQLSCVQLMTATLRLIERLNPTYKALVLQRDRHVLLEEAAIADQAPLATRGWLHGIPIAIKDLFHVQGLPTTMGGSPLADHTKQTVSDPFVQRLQTAGAIIIGKTNTPESGLGSHTYNRRHGTTRNAYDLQRSAGGSSGGAAVAVATRMLCVADGSDMMGSLRNPAGWNNVYSIRPTAGLLVENNIDDAAAGVIMDDGNPLGHPISTPGPVARTVRDLALLLETMAGRDKFEAPACFRSTNTATTTTLDTTQSGSGSSTVTTTDHQHPGNNNHKQFRILWLGDWQGGIPIEDGVLELCYGTLSHVMMESLGHDVVDGSSNSVFPIAKLWESWTTIRSAVIAATEIARHERETLLADDGAAVREELQWEIRRGLAIREEQLRDAAAIANEWSTTLSTTIWEEYDAIALPSAQCWPFPAEWKFPEEIAGQRMDTYHRWMEVVVPVSLAGLPCVTVPAGFGSPQHLPMGIQLAGRCGSDGRLLELAQAYHEATNWPSKQPPSSRGTTVQ